MIQQALALKPASYYLDLFWKGLEARGLVLPEESSYERQAHTGKFLNSAVCDDTSTGKVSPAFTSALSHFIGNNTANDAPFNEVMSFEVSVKPSKSQPWSEATRDQFGHSTGLCNPIEHNKSFFHRKIVDMASLLAGAFSPSPLTLPSDVRAIRFRLSTSMRSLKPSSSLLASIVVLASVLSPTMAPPSHDAEESLLATPVTPIGLYVACAIPVAAGIIGCCLTWKHKLVNSSWRNCLAVLSMMANVVWTCLVHWDKAPNFRKVVLALCRGLVYNFTLQLCMSSYGRLLPEALAINVGFLVAALLLDFLDALLVVAPNAQEPAAMPSSVTDLIWSGFLRWATSSLHFTSWAIMVKVAFYTCDVVITRHILPAPTTLYGRCVVHIVSFVGGLYGRIFPTVHQHRADQGRMAADRHIAVIGNRDLELGDMSPDLAFDNEQDNSNNQVMPVTGPSPRAYS